MDIDSKREKRNFSLCSLRRIGGGCHKNYFREPPFCFGRRWVVFPLFKKVFWKRYVLIARTIPFNISFKNSKKVSMIITSFPYRKEKDRMTTIHPSRFWLQVYFIINIYILRKNKRTFVFWVIKLGDEHNTFIGEFQRWIGCIIKLFLGLSWVICWWRCE